MADEEPSEEPEDPQEQPSESIAEEALLGMHNGDIDSEREDEQDEELEEETEIISKKEKKPNKRSCTGGSLSLSTFTWFRAELPSAIASVVVHDARFVGDDCIVLTRSHNGVIGSAPGATFA